MTTSSGRATQMHILDTRLQAYLQRNPFCNGPDAGLNEEGRQAITTTLAYRDASPPFVTTLLRADQTNLSPAEMQSLEHLFTQLKLPASLRRIHINDFAWEANMVPRTAKNILVVGCGNGIEMIFLRAVLPEATITAIDYGNSQSPDLQGILRYRFLEGDMNVYLKSLSREYDFVYSNHVMEHFYTPDEMLALLASLIVPGGTLVSILPMTGKAGVPFLKKLHHFAAGEAAHPVETVFLDAGHPWKTNPGDLAQTVKHAGFASVELFQRENHLSRPLRRSPFFYKLQRGFYVFSNMVFFGTLRSVLKLLFPKRVPQKLPKFLYALERRTYCGTNRVMNLFSEEALVRARMPD